MKRLGVALAMLTALAAPATAEPVVVDAGLPLGPGGVCALGSGPKAPLAILARKGRVASLPGVGNVLVSHATTRPSTNSVRRTHRARLPADTTWQGLPLSSIQTSTTAIEEGDSWAEHRLGFLAPVEIVRRRMAAVGHAIPPAGRKYDDEAFPPYGATERIVPIPGGSAIVCSLDG